jgi:signal peptidase II
MTAERARLSRSMKPDRRPSALCFAGLVACVASLVGCDHATKVAAETALRDRPPLQLVQGVVDLSYAENRDVAFDTMSRLSLHPASWMLVAFALATTAAVVGFWVRRRRAAWPEHAGFACVVGGAVGNIVDRAARGHVIDFIHVRFWPVFNVADVLVVVGVGLLVWAAARGQPETPPA